MFDNSKRAFIAINDEAEVCLIPKMANRHGLITGATGTGKTVTLQTLSETFSEMGVPVFAADMKGDLSGVAKIGGNKESVNKRVDGYNLKDKGYEPVSQIIGYIVSGDPTYITSHNNARALICKIERDELLEEMIKKYLDV